MPIHDWTRVHSAVYHCFHVSWVSYISRVLNCGLLPDTHYALIERQPEAVTPDETLLEREVNSVVQMPPILRHFAEVWVDEYTVKRKTIAIRRATDDRLVASLEIVSPGNKESKRSIEAFVDKAVEALARGYHLGIVDLFPVGPRDTKGIHHLIWSEFDSKPVYEMTAEEPLTQATFYAGNPKSAFLEPTAVGRDLIDLPVFLESDLSVLVPLESTYQEAFRTMPKKWRQVLEASM